MIFLPREGVLYEFSNGITGRRHIYVFMKICMCIRLKAR